MTNGRPAVSIVVPCFNAREFLTDTMRSVLAQTRADLELIIVDDGSTDGSAELVQAVTDPRVRYLRQDNAGVAAARNRGIAAAVAPYVAFLDADDLFLPANLERKVAFLDAHEDVDLVYSSETVFDSATGREIARTSGRPGAVLDALLEMRPGLIHSPSSVVVRRSALDRVGGFDPRLSTSADWDLWIRLAAGGPFGYIDEPLVRYRSHPQQMHRNVRLMMRDTLLVLEKSRAARLFASEDHFRYCTAKLYLVLAGSFLRDARDPVRFGTFFARSILTSTKPLRERLSRRRRVG